MNQEKIGKFISKIRKENNMTQQELAEKIGVSDKSISRWENGKTMPDLSLFKPLCDILGITINELLNGEKIDNYDYQDKLEESIINTINYSSKRIEQKNKFIGVIFLLFGGIINILGLMAFNPDTHACLFSLVLGIIFVIVGFYKLIKTTTIIKNIIYLILFVLGYIGINLLFDYLGVVNNKRAPIFSITITTINDTVYYDTIFYDVLRCNKDNDNETFKIIKNQEHDVEKLLYICE